MCARPNLLVCFVAALGFAVGALSVQHEYVREAGLGAILILGVVQISEIRRRAKVQRIREAMDVCHLSMTEAALCCQMDLADFSKMLSGERKLDCWRLEMLGDEFNAVLAMFELRDRPLPELFRCALKILPAVDALKERA